MKRRSVFALTLCLVVLGAVWVGYTMRRGPQGGPKAAANDRFVNERFIDERAAAALLRGEVGGYRKVHLIVALCDNKYQGIVPVPAALGNGQAPKSNLYWGARYGVKTHFKGSPDWRLLEERKKPFPHILERLIFRHATAKVYLVADAYDGEYIKEAITETVLASAGRHPEPIVIAGQTYVFGGGAQLLAYIGHNGLLEFSLDADITGRNTETRDAIILCCASHASFTPLLREAGAYPLLTTTNLMCHEAYTLEAALAAWVKNEPDKRIHERAAAAYSRYQRCSLPAAKALFHTGF